MMRKQMWSRSPSNFEKDHRDDLERQRVDQIVSLIDRLIQHPEGPVDMLRVNHACQAIERSSWRASLFEQEVYAYRELLRQLGIEDTVKDRFHVKIPGDG